MKHFKKIDQYGYRLSLTYNGQETHKTALGSFATVITFVCVLLALVVSITQLQNPKTDIINVYDLSLSLKEGKTFDYKDMNMRIAYQFKKGSREVFLNDTDDPQRYIKFKFKHMKKDFY